MTAQQRASKLRKIGRILKSHMKEKKLSYRDLAAASDMDVSAVHRVLNSGSPTTFLNIVALASALDVGLDELVK